jgi:hypothetical protein
VTDGSLPEEAGVEQYELYCLADRLFLDTPTDMWMTSSQTAAKAPTMIGHDSVAAWSLLAISQTPNGSFGNSG